MWNLAAEGNAENIYATLNAQFEALHVETVFDNTETMPRRRNKRIAGNRTFTKVGVSEQFRVCAKSLQVALQVLPKEGMLRVTCGGDPEAQSIHFKVEVL